jgi:aspartyl protease family protein
MRLVPDSRGHYWAQGTVNGASIRFMVDTGATLVAISADEATRAGVNYRAGRPIQISTANGNTTAYLVRLDKIAIGGIVLHGVEASVHEGGLGVALLGMSFMNRVDMRRDGGNLVLVRRY